MPRGLRREVRFDGHGLLSLAYPARPAKLLLLPQVEPASNERDAAASAIVAKHSVRAVIAGGIALKKNGKVAGAIGARDGSGEQDHAVAEAGAAAFSYQPEGEVHPLWRITMESFFSVRARSRCSRSTIPNL
ncbi:heme-binding protein [Paracidobacterium acidisoli]|uniref:heme-binding protein n=1 Tax=Paracidobacterium acidisoli TaxID=2303751 RepID=UPI003314A89F